MSEEAYALLDGHLQSASVSLGCALKSCESADIAALAERLSILKVGVDGARNFLSTEGIQVLDSSGVAGMGDLGVAGLPLGDLLELIARIKATPAAEIEALLKALPDYKLEAIKNIAVRRDDMTTVMLYLLRFRPSVQLNVGGSFFHIISCTHRITAMPNPTVWISAIKGSHTLSGGTIQPYNEEAIAHRFGMRAHCREVNLVATNGPTVIRLNGNIAIDQDIDDTTANVHCSSFHDGTFQCTVDSNGQFPEFIHDILSELKPLAIKLALGEALRKIVRDKSPLE